MRIGMKTLAFVFLLSSVSHAYELNDSHFHLTNYIQEGTEIHAFLQMMGERVGRVALFGIPLQQQWSYRVSGNRAPKYHSIITLLPTPRSRWPTNH
jgi:hypothetical protein